MTVLEFRSCARRVVEVHVEGHADPSVGGRGNPTSPHGYIAICALRVRRDERAKDDGRAAALAAHQPLHCRFDFGGRETPPRTKSAAGDGSSSTPVRSAWRRRGRARNHAGDQRPEFSRWRFGTRNMSRHRRAHASKRSGEHMRDHGPAHTFWISSNSQERHLAVGGGIALDRDIKTNQRGMAGRIALRRGDRATLRRP